MITCIYRCICGESLATESDAVAHLDEGDAGHEISTVFVRGSD